MTSLRGLAVVGAGVYGPAGRDATETTLLLRTGIPSVGPAPFSDGTGAPITMGLAPALGEQAGFERLVALGGRALIACLRDATKVFGARPIRLGLSLSYSPGEMVGAADGAALGTALARAIELDAGAPRSCVLDAAGTSADRLLDAANWVARGEVDVALWGGLHSDYAAARIAALGENGKLYTNENIDGSFPGEHAAFVAIAKPARAKGESPLATFIEAGAADGETEGPRAWDAMPELLRSVAPDGFGQPAGWIFGDVAFDPREIHAYGALLTRAEKYFAAPYLLDYPAQRVGALGAAALPLGVALVGTSWAMGHSPSRTAVIVSQNESGRRGLVALTQPEAMRAR